MSLPRSAVLPTALLGIAILVSPKIAFADDAGFEDVTPSPSFYYESDENEFFWWDTTGSGDEYAISVEVRDDPALENDRWRIDCEEPGENDFPALEAEFSATVDLEGLYGPRDPETSRFRVRVLLAFRDEPLLDTLTITIGSLSPVVFAIGEDIELTYNFETDRLEGSVDIDVDDEEIDDILDDEGRTRVRGKYRDGDNTNHMGGAGAVALKLNVFYEPGDDLTPPTGSIGSPNAPATSSQLALLIPSATDAGSGMDAMRFKNESGGFTTWEPYSNGLFFWTLSAGEGDKTVTAEYRDLAGNVSSATVDITYDTTPPTGSLTIDSAAENTASSDVVLTVTGADAGSGVASMRFGDGSLADGLWEDFATTRSWSLPGADGQKSVAVQLRDAAGNQSMLHYTDSIVLDTTAPTLGTSIADGATYATSPDVTVSLSHFDALTGVSAYRLRVADGVFGPWLVLDPAPANGANITPATAALGTADGVTNVEAQVRDAAGNESTTAPDSIILDTTAPTSGITIGGGAAFTHDTLLDLVFTGADATSGVVEMRFGVGALDLVPWTSFLEAGAFELPETTDGSKDVNFQTRDAAGNESEVASDAIVLDRTPPTGSVVIAGGNAFTNSRDVSVAITASDPTSGVAEMRLRTGTSTWGPWQDAAATLDLQLPDVEGPTTVELQLRDHAGNVAEEAGSDGITLDRIAPSGSFAIESGATYTRARLVTLDLGSLSDTGSGLGEMRLRNEPGNWSSWQAVQSSPIWALEVGDGEKTVEIEVRDRAGNRASFTDSIILDSTAPTGSLVIADGAAAVNDPRVLLQLDYADLNSGVAAIRVFGDAGDTGWRSPTASLSWDLGSGDGRRFVELSVRDAAGNESTVDIEDEVLLDMTAPDGTFTLNGEALYVLPWEDVVAATMAEDRAGGAGLDAVRYRQDGGDWSSWMATSGVEAFTFEAGRGDRTFSSEFEAEWRDLAGNVSAPFRVSVPLIGLEPPNLSDAKKIEGSLDGPAELDLFRIDVLSGDLLKLTLTTDAFVPGEFFDVDLDVYDVLTMRQLDSFTLVPRKRKSRGDWRFDSTEATGRLLFILRSSGPAAGGGGTYSAKLKVTTPGSAVRKGLSFDNAPFELPVAVVAGAALNIKLTGVAEPPVLVSPDGEVSAPLPGKFRNGKFVLKRSAALTVTGIWTLRTTAPSTVKFKVVRIPRKRKSTSFGL